MKKLCIVFCFIGLTAMAQNREIEFRDGDWKTQLATAKKENKLIFFDAYTTWCGPCKVMARDVFTKDDVADLFNDKFVNAKFDMEKGEGVGLAKEYGVSAYPTYLFINGDGELVHKIVGSMSAQVFIEEANNALHPENTLYGLANAFEASGHSEESAIAYFQALDKAYEAGEMSIASKQFFDAVPKADLFDDHHWKLALKYLNNPSSQAFAYLYRNKKYLEDKYGERGVNAYFQRVFNFTVQRIKRAYESGSGVKEAKESSKAISELLKDGNAYSKELLTKLDLIESAQMGQWDQFVAKVQSIFEDDQFNGKSGVVITAAHDILTSNQKKYYDDVLKWARLIEKSKPELFTQIQLAELRKRAYKHQGKEKKQEIMAQKEKELRQEAADQFIMTPPLRKD